MFTLTIDASELLTALILTIPCASTTRHGPPGLGCVALITHLGVQSARTDVVSTDGHRLSLWQSETCTRKKNADAAIGSFFDEITKQDADEIITILIPRESAIKIQKAIVAYKRDLPDRTDLTVTFVLESPKLARATIGLDVISISIDDNAQFPPYEAIIPTARMSSDSGGFCLSGKYLSDFADSLSKACKQNSGLLIFHGDCLDPVVLRSNIRELSNWFGIISPIRYFDNKSKPSSTETIRQQTPKYQGLTLRERNDSPSDA